MVKFGCDPKWLAVVVIRSTNFPPLLLLLAEVKCIMGCIYDEGGGASGDN